MVNLDSIAESYWRSLRLSLVSTSSNTLPKLWVFKSDEIDTLDILSISHQQVTIRTVFGGLAYTFSFIYTSTFYINRRSLWSDLFSVHESINGPWLLAGDFNAILGTHEQIGGILPGMLSCADFQGFLDRCELIQLPTTGLFYTWARDRFDTGHLERKLDRVLCNSTWLGTWFFSSCHVPRTVSDHPPLLINCTDSVDNGPKPFRFQSMWLQHPDFKSFARQVWNYKLL